MKKKLKVMIVEDDRFLLKAYEIKFRQSNINAILAKDGAEGLALAESELPSLIILDLMLPKMNGFEVLEKLKGNEKLKNIPVITISVLGQKIDQEKMKALEQRSVEFEAEIKSLCKSGKRDKAEKKVLSFIWLIGFISGMVGFYYHDRPFDVWLSHLIVQYGILMLIFGLAYLLCHLIHKSIYRYNKRRKILCHGLQGKRLHLKKLRE